jgi:hypothetical protein
MIKTQYNMHPKIIRTDNGKEYVNQELSNWCRNQGLMFEFAAPYSPQQNGVAEHYNRTLEELMRAMLEARNSPLSLWLAAIQHAAYLRNCSYTCAIANKTPYERWFRQRPDVAHFYEFGIPVHVLQDGENQSKIEPKALTHTFVSFDDPFPSIRYYNTHSHNIKTTRNYSFHVQREGESGDVDSMSSSQKQECEGDSVNQPTMSENKKRKREDENSGLPRCSTRPRVTHDYRQLNDPGLSNELAEIMCEEENNSPITATEAIYLAYNDSSLAPDDPLTL